MGWGDMFGGSGQKSVLPTSGGADADSGGGVKTWQDWRLVNGRWEADEYSGKEPRRKWVSGGLQNDPTTGKVIHVKGHWTHPTMHQKETTPVAKSTDSSKPKLPAQSPGRRRERYFNPYTGKWAYRLRYVPTNAEYAAKKAGLHHDDRGYYRSNDGRRQYVTGKVGNRRYHMVAGKRVWDDPSINPYAVSSRRRRLKERRTELKSRIDSLKDQYKRSRSDQHILRRNIVRRLHITERALDRVRASLKRLPLVAPFRLKSKEHKYKGAITVTIEFGVENGYDRHQPLVFSTYLWAHRNEKVWLRATITLVDRDWKPGRLASPDMLRVHWSLPKDWLLLDDVKRETDEFMVSNPLMITRVVRSPTKGDSTPQFTCKAWVYEYAYGTFDNSHKAGFG